LKSTYRWIMATSGVSGVVRYGNRVPQIPEAFIGEIKSRLEAEDTHEEPETAIRAGQEVTVLEGPFKDWEAIVSGVIPARERVAILVEFLGRTLEVQVAAHSLLAKADEDPKLNAFGREPAEEKVPEKSREKALAGLRRDPKRR